MTPPAPITYRFERADLWRLGQMLFRPSWKARLFRVGFLILCMLAGLVLGFGKWPNPREWSFIMRAPYIVGPVLVLLLLSQFSQYINVVTLWARFRSLGLADKEVRLAFSDEALATDVGDIHGTVPWRNFTRLVEEHDRAFLKVARFEAVTVPRRAFPDDAAWQDALAFLREKVPHA